MTEHKDKHDWHRPNEEMHGKQTSCPKCELEFKTMLAPFCTHHECPVRDWEDAQDALRAVTEHKDEAMTLEQVRDELRYCAKGSYQVPALVLADAIDAAIKQREQDAKDAARYRWLRDFADSYTWDYLGGIGADRVDAAIDAAMAKESSNG